MATTFPTIEGAYARDLLQQPDALRRANLVALPDGLQKIAEAISNNPHAHVVLTGMGSSFHALHSIAMRLSEGGIPVAMLETSELIYYWQHLLGQNTVVVAVSQSGRSAEIIRLAEIDAGRSTLVAVTNDPSSPLASAAHSLILMNAGSESTVSCKTYLCTLLLLDRVAETLSGGNLANVPSRSEQVIDAVESYLAGWRDHVEEAQVRLRDVHHIVFAGRGPSLAAANTGALIIKESARFPAEGMSAAAFRHGPLEMINARMLLVMLQGDARSSALNERLVQDVNQLGGRALLVSTREASGLLCLPQAHPRLQSIVEILPAQMISLALAARERREAGAFALASKITATE